METNDKDPQAKALYGWENKAVYKNGNVFFGPTTVEKMDFSMVKVLVKLIWKYEKKNFKEFLSCRHQPNVLIQTNKRIHKLGEGNGLVVASYAGAWYGEGYKGALFLPRYHTSRELICHEMAHVFTPDIVEPHGKEFVGIYIYLLEKYAGYNAGELITSAVKDGLRVVKI